MQNSQTESNLSSSLQSHYSLEDNGKSERIASQFSFTEIKRKFKHAMGKERNGIISNAITHRFPYEHQKSGNGDKGVACETGVWGSPNRNHFYNERFARPSIGIRRGDKFDKPEDAETSMGNEIVGYPEQRVSNIYVEAKKHLSEMLSNGDEIEDFSSRHPLGPSRQSLESQSCITNDNPDDKEQDLNSNHNGSDELNHANAVEETSCCTRDEMSSEADAEIVETSVTVFPEKSKALEVSAEGSSNKDDQHGDSAEVCDEEKYAQCLKLDSFEGDQSLSSPVNFPIKLFNHQEKDISPASTKSLPVESRMQPLQIHLEEQVFSAIDQGMCVRTCLEDEESSFEYVEAVLLGSGLNWDEFLLRWLSSEQLLDPSLFDEVELFSNRSCHDQQLLFDCTNEVLKEVCEHYFGYSPWVSFVKQNIRPVPKGKNLIREVWEGVEWHLLQQPPPRTLDQIVRKDMEKTGKWMDLRLDAENIAFEMGEDILEDLMEDTILSLVNEHLESEFSALPADLKESEISIHL
ncbi:hypothetical protein F0562_019234 [Nyssa sinensis]|uniref:DUF4378 domain-containing protein n=1 Tax=Nyssa sinensis TaxID=561372 RepID=A0A5J4ZBS2_9ASTE|nr:hypothetical protein F0562_019234 [Nyssa sinensis]